ncbi:DUF3617 domain-containing protein [Asticcacaulis sp. AC466]|uniref:DUF3617 domain-containing protein n=1 Tax=Asticcacaulis sp. AC466 TaxID=1282362 RepID=UPI0012DE96D6|nr:DUF3617 family protein [Asticcacaulis sp. AC466]
MSGRGIQYCALIGLVCLVAACDKKPEKPQTPFVEDGAELSEAASSEAVGEMSASVSAESAAAAQTYTVSRLGQRAGLWQLTQTLPQVDGKSVAKICVDDAQGEKLAYIGHDLPGKAEMVDLSCSARSVKKLHDGADIDTICMIKDTTLTSHIHVDVIGNEAFHQSVETRYSPAFAGHGAQMTITDAKWLGACPSSMKPGDYITGDGVHLKVGKLLAKFG